MDGEDAEQVPKHRIPGKFLNKQRRLTLENIYWYKTFFFHPKGVQKSKTHLLDGLQVVRVSDSVERALQGHVFKGNQDLRDKNINFRQKSSKTCLK